MAAIPLEKEIHYPDSDGEPMAESELHLEEMVYIWEGLVERFAAAPDVFVGADMFLYFRKGDPAGVVAPDAFVVKGVPKLPGGRKRKKYLLWQEGQAPCFVLETTSESTRRKDEEKREIYARLGVAEYFQFDPEGDYLNPRLQGLRLVSGKYRPVRPQPDGSLLSEATGVLFHVEGERIRLTDAASGALFLRNEEKTRIVHESTARLEAEATARRQAEARLRVLEEELARLRALRSQD